MRKHEQRSRLAALLQRLAPDLAVELGRVRDVRDLQREIRGQIVDVLGHEFAERGLRSDDEPNAYGLELEELIDACGLAWDE